MAYINGSQTIFSTIGTKVTKGGAYQSEWSADDVDTLKTDVDGLKTEVNTLNETVANIEIASTGKTLIEDIVISVGINDTTYVNDAEDVYLPFTNTKYYIDSTSGTMAELNAIPDGTWGRIYLMGYGGWHPFFKTSGADLVPSIYIYCSDMAICFKQITNGYSCYVSYNGSDVPVTSIVITSIEY